MRVIMAQVLKQSKDITQKTQPQISFFSVIIDGKLLDKILTV